MEQGRDRVLVEVADHDQVLVGQARDGEPWAAAARRLVGEVTAPPVPLDLSGPTKRFVVDRDVRVTVRDMTRGDLRDVTRWRAQPHVARWWAGDGEATYDAVERRYGPRIDGETPTRMWVLEVNGRSVGFGQHYRIADYPDYALLGPDPAAIGVDYAIGEPEWTGRGLGSRMIWAWVLRARATVPGGPRLLRGARPPQRRLAEGAGEGRLRRGPVVRRAGPRRRRRHRRRVHLRRGHRHRLSPRSNPSTSPARTART